MKIWKVDRHDKNQNKKTNSWYQKIWQGFSQLLGKIIKLGS